MKPNKNTVYLVLVGLFAIGAAWWYRQDTLKRRAAAARPPVASSTVLQDAALQQRTTVLQAQATQLQARLASRPDDIPLHQALLLTYQQLGQVDQAMEQLEAIGRLQPNRPEVHLALANGRLALKQWTQAEQAYDDLTQRWPKNAEGWQGLAASRFHQGHFQEAAVAAQHAQKLDPDNPSNRYVLASALLEYAMQYPQPQLHTAALEWSRKEFEKLTQVWPKAGDLYLRLGRIGIATRDLSGSIKNMEAAARLLPDQPDVPLYLAKAYVAGHDRKKGRQALEQGLARHPDSADLNDALGQLIQSSGEPNADQQALALFQKATQLSPNSSRFQERLGTAYQRTNQLQEARQAFEIAARLNPNRAFPFQQLASLYTRLGDPKRAAEAAKISEALNFNAQQLSHLEALVNTHPENIALHLTLADRYRFLGSHGAARNEYLSILHLDPQNARAKQGLTALDKPQTATQTASAPSDSDSTLPTVGSHQTTR